MRRPRDIDKYITAEEAARFYEDCAAKIRKIGGRCQEHMFKVYVNEMFWCPFWIDHTTKKKCGLKKP